MDLKNLFSKKQKDSTSLQSLLDEHFPFVQIIDATQEEIASLSKNAFYEKEQQGVYESGEPYAFPAYRSAEIFFWNPILRWLYDDSKKRKIKRVLDIGSGYGTLSLYMKNLTGCDSYLVDFIDFYMSKELVRKHSFKFKVINIELKKIPFGDTKFDTILLTEVIEHFNFNPVLTLGKIAKRLEDDGRIYITTPDAYEWGRLTKFYKDWKDIPKPNKNSKILDAHIYQYTKDEILEVIEKSGLEVERFDYAPGYKNSARHFCISCKRRS